MAVLTKTTLAAAITVNDYNQPIKVASVSAGTGSQGFVKGSVIRIDNEYFKQTADYTGVMVPVRGGEQGTFCQPHASGAVVLAGSGADFESSPAGTDLPTPVQPVWSQVTYTAAGAIAIPTTQTNLYVMLLAGTGAAMTLANPTYSQAGQEMIIMAQDAQAYTVTNPGGFLGTTTSSDVATFNGAIGSTLHIRAVGLLWLVVSGITAGVSVA